MGKMPSLEDNIYAEQSKAEIFLESLEIKVLKFISILLNCTVGPPNRGRGGGSGYPVGSAGGTM